MRGLMRGLLLAAGRGSRYLANNLASDSPATDNPDANNPNKLLHPLADGTPMVLAAARNLKAALPDVLVVINGHDPVLADLLQQARLPFTVCPLAAQGMGASLAWGVAQSRAAGGWLIALADMPWIQPATIRTVADAVTGPRTIAAPQHQGRRGHPVAFGRDYAGELMALQGDTGARHLVETHGKEVVLLPCGDAGVLRDVDLRGDSCGPHGC